MMDSVSECIRKVKHNLSKELCSSKELSKSLKLLDTPPTTEPDSPASADVQSSDFIDLLNEQTNTSITTASSTKEEDCASTSSSKNSNSSIICKWTNCDWPGHSDDLVDHIREIHVDLQPYHYHDQVNASNGSSYVCLWQGCKVYGKSSLCKSWLENHVLQHSGPRPFKCIFENCGQRFKTRSLLEKHVNNHFASSNCDCTNLLDCTHQDSNSLNSKLNCDLLTGQMIKSSKTASFAASLAVASPTGTPSKTLKKKKKLKRRLVNVKTNNDLFDDCTMHRLKYSLIQLNSITGLDIIGDQRVLTFHAKVVAKCQEAKTGLVKLLIRWQPEDIIDDQWVNESDASKMLIKKMPINSLPRESVDKLSEFFFPKEKEIRIKQRRK